MTDVRVGVGEQNTTHDVSLSDGNETWGLKLDGGIQSVQETSQTASTILQRGGAQKWGDYDPTFGHLQQDTLELLNQQWDMIIAFPPCTYLTVTGNRWFNVDKYGDKAVKRLKDREKAVRFFMAIANADCERIAIENPVGVMSTHWRKPDQIINPYQFGDAFEKKTCLWLKDLPLLKETSVVEPPPRTFYKSGKSMPSWYADAIKLPKAERSKIRSKTFPGIAKAMAQQWSKL